MNLRGPQSLSRYAPINQSVSILKNKCPNVLCANEYVTTCQILPCRTSTGTNANQPSVRRKAMWNTLSRISWARKIPVQVRMMRFTHPANGGKLTEMVCPRGTIFIFLAPAHPAGCDDPPHLPRAHRISHYPSKPSGLHAYRY